MAEGRMRIPEGAVREVFKMIRRERKLAFEQAAKILTKVERETLTLFANGSTNAEIAEARGRKRRDRAEHPLPHPGQAGNRDEAGTGDLGLSATAWWRT